MNLGKLQDILKGREACHAAVHGVVLSQTRLSNGTTITSKSSKYFRKWKFFGSVFYEMHCSQLFPLLTLETFTAIHVYIELNILFYTSLPCILPIINLVGGPILKGRFIHLCDAWQGLKLMNPLPVCIPRISPKNHHPAQAVPYSLPLTQI